MKRLTLFLIFLILSISIFARPYVIINEFMYDNAGTDTNCYVELKGTPGASLDSVKVIEINGNGGAITKTIMLNGKTIPADSYYVIAQSAGVVNYDTIVGTTGDFQNGPCDNILVVYDSIGLASRVTLDAVTYGLPLGSDSVFRGKVWPTYDVAPLADGSYYAIMARHSNFAIDNNYYDYAHFMEKTPGAPNPIKLDTTVYAMQYTTNMTGNSELNTKTIRCQFVVITARFFADSMLYYGAQTEGAWNGIAIKGNIGPDTFEIGDTILLEHGLVFERYGRTEIRSPGMERTSLSPITPAIQPTLITIPDVGEQYEAVLVKFENVTVVTVPDANGEWKVSIGADTLSVDNMASYTVPSVGARINIAGILDYSFGIYKLQPRGNSDITMIYSIDGTVSLSDAPVDSSGTIVTIRELAVADTTDASGFYEFPAVAEDAYTLVFEHPGYNSDSLTVSLSSDTTIDFSLSNVPTYTLSGIIGLNDNPADTLDVSVILRDSLTAVNVETDSSGYYEITGIFAGDYSLIISKDYYSQDSLDITISSDTVYNTSLDRLTGSIWGYVGLNNAPADSSGSIVIIDVSMSTDTTDVHGEYGFSGLDLGYTYTLIFQHTDYTADTNDIFLDLSSEQYNVTLIQISGITDETVEKVIVENNESGLSFTYNKSVDTPTVMRLYDLTGRNVMTQDIMGSKGVYSLSVNKKLSKGVYFIQITGEDKPFVKKFVIVK